MPSVNPSKGSLAPSKPFSISLGTKAKPKSALSNGSAPQISKKRPHSALADPDSDNEESKSIVETVTGFDSGKAISVNQTPNQKVPLVIKAEKNRDWRAESQRKKSKNLLPAEVQAAQNGAHKQNGAESRNTERAEVSQEAGLRFVARKDANGDVPMVENTLISEAVSQNPVQSADEEAIAALLGAEKKLTLTIPAQSADADLHGHDPGDSPPDRLGNEDDRFRADVASRPDPASLAEYANIPVSEFGKAALRGMGWKEGDPIGKRRNRTAGANAKPRDVQRRPALLGIGAKETPGANSGEIELGAWGQGTKGKKGANKAEPYNPVMLRNSETGEMITEEELELRKVKAKTKTKGKGDQSGSGGGAARDEENWRDRRDRNLAIDDRKKKDRDRMGDEGEKNGYRSRRDRSREKDRDRERDKDGDRAKDRRKDHSSFKRERSWSGERSGYSSSSRKHRSRSGERSRQGGSSRRERNRSAERRHRKRDRDKEYDYDYDRREREGERDSRRR